jgi:hypothetical protein
LTESDVAFSVLWPARLIAIDLIILSRYLKLNFWNSTIFRGSPQENYNQSLSRLARGLIGSRSSVFHVILLISSSWFEPHSCMPFQPFLVSGNINRYVKKSWELHPNGRVLKHRWNHHLGSVHHVLTMTPKNICLAVQLGLQYCVCINI